MNPTLVFVRFVVREIDSDSNQRKGIFQAAADLCDRTSISDAERTWMNVVRGWFAQELPRPATLATSKRHNSLNRGVSWFKETAREHIAQARSLVAWLEQQGVAVEELRSTRPGYVLYEDEFQVVVDPFS